MKVLVLEASTSSAKAMVYDKEKGVLALDTLPYGPSVGDVYTQDADAVLESVLSTGRKTAASHDVAAIAVVGAWHSILCCDHKMDPVMKAYTWAFTGASGVAAGLRKDEAFTNHVYETTGCMVHALYPMLKLIYFKENGLLPENCLLTEQSSYIFYKLTGERLSTDCLLSGSALFSYKKHDIDSAILERLGLKRGQFAEITTYKDARPLSKKMAERLGLSPGIPVVPAMPDGAMNQVGSGALQSGLMTLSIGTSAALRMSYDHPVISPKRETWCYMAPGKYLAGAAVQGSTNCVDWFAGEIMANRFTYRELDEASVCSADAPVFLPFLYGERCPGWRDERKGGFYGVTGRHTYKDLYFALLEGVVMNIRQCYAALCKLTGAPKEVRVSGGILKSHVWSQILCDILGRELFMSRSEQASMLGGAVLALHAAGDWQDIADVPVQGYAMAPDLERHEFFNERYARYLHYYTQGV